MDKYIEELMQIKVISENDELSKMLEDIKPLNTQTIEVNKKHEFSIVVYKKQNIVVKFFKEIGYALSKIRIMKKSAQLELNKIPNNNYK